MNIKVAHAFANRFNPRTREGCDAPGLQLSDHFKSFQSTHPRGVRPRNATATGRNRWFQSTHPRGVRHFSNIKDKHQRRRFNPRTREGCDNDHNKNILHLSRFQSTHPRGVRQIKRRKVFYLSNVSIHAPARGATNNCIKLNQTKNKFQSTHPRGVRPLTKSQIATKAGFQSTHPRGVRQYFIQSCCPSTYGFNPRTREGCDMQC